MPSTQHPALMPPPMLNHADMEKTVDGLLVSKKSSFLNPQLQPLHLKIPGMDIASSLAHGREESPPKTPANLQIRNENLMKAIISSAIMYLTVFYTTELFCCHPAN